MKYKSIAYWPVSDKNWISESTDTHDTKEQAEAVCEMLRRIGMGGEGIVFPTLTRVEEIKS